MARNPSMTAAKTAVFSTSTTHKSGPAAGSTENDQSNWFPSRHIGEPATKALTAPALESILGYHPGCFPRFNGGNPCSNSPSNSLLTIQQAETKYRSRPTKRFFTEYTLPKPSSGFQ